MLRKYSQPVRFTCEAHVEWGMKFSSKIITNLFYVVSGFKSRQRFIVESRSNYNQGTYLVRPAAWVV